MNVSGVGGFDIIPTDPSYGYGALYVNSELLSAIYKIDLSSGLTTKLAKLNVTTNLLSFAAVKLASMVSIQSYNYVLHTFDAPVTTSQFSGAKTLGVSAIPSVIAIAALVLAPLLRKESF